MPKVYISSTNKTKVGAVESIFVGWKVVSQDGQSDVSNQPFGEEETMLGAINRAYNLPKGNIRIGLEGGISLMKNPLTNEEVMFVINYGALVDEDDNLYVASGAKIPLPEEIKQELISRKKELGEVMNAYTNKKDIPSTKGAIGVFTNDIVSRREVFTHIVKILYGQYLNKNKI